MDLPQVKASVRLRSGKGPSRRLRGRGLVPAVLYGQGTDTTSLAIAPKDIVKALSGPLRTNTVITLDIAGADGSGNTSCTAMVRDHQFDPITRVLLHVDFLAVDINKPIKAQVPLELHGRSVGEQMGGNLSVVFRELPVECLPADLPAAITADITGLELNANLTVAELEIPENVTVLLPENTTVASIVSKRAEEEEKPEEELEEEGAEGEGGEAKPGEEQAAADSKSEEKPS